MKLEDEIENKVRRKAQWLADGQKDNWFVVKSLMLNIKSLIHKQYCIKEYSEFSLDERDNVLGFIDYLSAFDVVNESK